MRKVKSYNKFDTSEFNIARSFARKLMNKDGNISDKLAGNLIILNVLEELLSLFIDYCHNHIMVKTYSDIEDNKIKLAYIREVEPSSSKYMRTIGEKIKFIETSLMFDQKEDLVKLLNNVNRFRAKAIHKMLPSGHIRNSKLLLTNCEAIYSNSEKSIELIFNISGNLRKAEPI